MKTTRMISWLLVLLMCIGLLAGCAQAPADAGEESPANDVDATNEPASTEKIVIDFQPCLVSIASMETMERVVEKFEAQYENVDVQMTVQRDYTTYKLAFDAGKGPDICYLDDSNQTLLQSNGFLMDITDDVIARGWIEKSIAGAVAFQNLRTPGKYYSVPHLMSPVVMYYNKDIFTAANVTEPTTWEEFEAMLRTIKDAGYIPFEGTPDHVSWMIGDIMMNSVSMDDVRKWYYRQETTDAFYTAYESAFQTISDWLKAGYFRENIASVDGSTVAALFASGETAMLNDGDWDLVTLQDTGLNLGTFTLPSKNNTGKHVIVNSPESAYCLNANMDDAKKEACINLLDMLFDEEVVGWYYEAGFSPTVLRDTSDLQLSDLKKDMLATIADTDMGYFLDNTVSGMWDVYTKVIQQMFTGEYDGTQAWEFAYSEYERLISE